MSRAAEEVGAGAEGAAEAITQIRRFRFTRRRIEMCVPHELPLLLLQPS